MNPSEEEEDTADSTAVLNKQESVSIDQETDGPPTQSEEDSSPKSSTTTASSPTLQGIAGNVAGFVKTQITNLSNIRKSIPGCPPKKSKRAHPDSESDYLFDVVVTDSDCLTIPYNVSVDYFPASAATLSSPFTEQTIQLTDPLNRLWPNIAYVCFDAENAFILTRNWAQYADEFCLQLMDIVRFVRPNPTIRLGPNHFMTQHFPRPESEPVQITHPNFLPKNFLFQVELGKGGMGLARLVIGAELVWLFLPGLRMELKKEMVKLTDYQNKDWFLMMVYSGIRNRYIVMDEWEGFVSEHELEVGDRVQFYKPVIISHNKHFLIRFVRREQEQDRLTNQGRSDCGSDDGQKQTGEQFPSSLPSVPPGISAEDLSVIRMILESDGRENLDEFMKQQQQAYPILQQISKPLQESATGKSLQNETGLEPKGENDIDDFGFNPFIIELSQKETVMDPKGENDCDHYDSDPEDDESQALIFELNVSDSDCLIIPNWMMNDEFPLLMLHPDREETLQLTDHLDHKWDVTLTYNPDLDAYIFTKGWSSYLKNYHLKSSDLIRCYKNVPQTHPNHYLILLQRKFGESQYLFRVLVSRSNRLRILFDRLVGPFSLPEALPPPKHLCEYTIYVTDYLDQTWEMRLLRFEEEEAYVVVRGWEQYVARHGLRHKDRISFYRRNLSRDRNSFLIHHELRCKPDDDFELPLFLRENIICELCLSEADVRFGRLMMPAVELPFLSRIRDMVKLTDENNKDWFVIIVQVEEGSMIIDGWEGYVKEFELEAGDMVRLYNPGCADHDYHFLIECGKNKTKRTEKEEGDGSGSDHGDGAAPSQGCNQNGKEKLGI